MRLEIVQIVLLKFIQCGSCDVGELDFRLLACAARRASLGYVLLAAPCGLNHLIHRAVAMRRQKPSAEKHRALIYHIALVVNDEIAESSMRQHDLRGFALNH